MTPEPIRIASDYNRGLPLPVRLVHVAFAILSSLVAPVLRWADDHRRRDWASPLLWGTVAVAVLLPIDVWIMSRVTADGSRGSLPLGGDLRRELEALQQFGQGASIILIAAAIWLLDPARRRRLLDWLAAIVVAGIACVAAKALFGRTRPSLDEAGTFIGPFGAYPFAQGEPFLRSWQVWRSEASRLWSMPSSHTTYAVVASVFLSAMYPRLRALVWTLAFVVAFARVALGAHYPADVAAGWAVGLAAARPAVRRGWGVRAIDWAWRKAVDPNASPAWKPEDSCTTRADRRS
ncbi:MAG: phosphatase PAP2 family protein [Leptolyngbya sp. PLA2]|nr:phosphatase PAP2 family protein [Leptolyngbya sp.]MCE7972194.1 phosphatase PAP2 family protein [Leptolyngbya sp. PL-A2]MCQ3941228.1 hypothetical protein [cyanobacterium CYA1]MDL1905513.1 phosphatase PAP2 family protein [Synechococcales cyanobacterium CNB]GIK18246.1 MAG: hypothetical protein BroJett004_04100 [Planctomycetota bacterium]